MAEASPPDGRAPTTHVDRMPVAPWVLVVCLAVYVVLAVRFQVVVLNWVVGPLFLLIVLDVVPRTWRLLVRKLRGGR